MCPVDLVLMPQNYMTVLRPGPALGLLLRRFFIGRVHLSE